jgi:hypothetical protein
MLQTIRAHGYKISAGLLLATALGVGGTQLYRHFAGDCCQAGSSCCYPGSPCCHARHVAGR